MKPKVKIYNYENLPATGYSSLLIKDDAPMDLSIKRHSPENSVPSFHSHLHSKNKLFHGFAPLQYSFDNNESSSNLFANLINTCSYERSPPLLRRSTSNTNGYPKVSCYSDQCRNKSEPNVPYFNKSLNLKTKCSTKQENRYSNFNTSPSPMSIQSQSPDFVGVQSSIDYSNGFNDKHLNHRSLNYLHEMQKYFLIKSKSESSLVDCAYREERRCLKRWKSETDIVYEQKYSTEQRLIYGSHINSHSMPFNLSSHVVDSRRVHSERIAPREESPSSLHHSDEEDMISDEFESDDALDLRMRNSSVPRKANPLHLDSEYFFQHINNLLTDGTLQKDTNSLNAWDVYKQYYCYLLNQPSIASRAVAAAAMAESYAKLMNPSIGGSPPQQMPPTGYQHSPSKYSSPESYDLCNGKTELRSADTTNGVDANGDRKRISRPLTGRHVRHGTGASPQTLLTLRNMIQERQRMKELGHATGQSKHKANRKNPKRK